MKVTLTDYSEAVLVDNTLDTLFDETINLTNK